MTTTQPKPTEIRVCKCGARAIFKNNKFNEFDFLPNRNKMACELALSGIGSNGTRKHKWEKVQS